MIIDMPGGKCLPQLRSLWQEAFGDGDAFLDTFFGTAFSPQRCRCVFVDGQVEAALYWFRCGYMGKPIAYLYGVATAKRYRGQGLCRKLMGNTHEHLAGQGYEAAVLVPGEKPLFQMYEAMGYQPCGGITEIHCQSGQWKTPLRRIDGEVYARLRREYLPSGGIVQEKENLKFLQTQATLYVGNDFLLAARQNNDELVGLELLGNTSAAPGILRALDCESGTFRIPGDSPFAMYHPLGESTLPIPKYFGLAFD